MKTDPTGGFRTMAEMNAIIEGNHHRKKPNQSFIAKYRGTCSRCHEEILVGERCHYVDGKLVHHQHSRE